MATILKKRPRLNTVLYLLTLVREKRNEYTRMYSAVQVIQEFEVNSGLACNQFLFEGIDRLR